MKRELLFMFIPALFAVPATSFGLSNDLVNGDFETGSLPPWVAGVGDVGVVASDFGYPAAPDGGDYKCGVGWITNENREDWVSQVIPAQEPPFQPKGVNITGMIYTHTNDTGHAAEIGFGIIQYDEEILEITVAPVPGTWSSVDLTIPPEAWELVCDEFTLRVVFSWTPGAAEGAAGYLFVDNLRVESYCIPEPATLLLLAAGGLALVKRKSI
jgi:hypothetical protein